MRVRRGWGCHVVGDGVGCPRWVQRRPGTDDTPGIICACATGLRLGGGRGLQEDRLRDLGPVVRAKTTDVGHGAKGDTGDNGRNDPDYLHDAASCRVEAPEARVTPQV